MTGILLRIRRLGVRVPPSAPGHSTFSVILSGRSPALGANLGEQRQLPDDAVVDKQMATG